MPKSSVLCGFSLALFSCLLGLRYLLHRGLTPQSTTKGLQPVDLDLPARSVKIPGAQGLTLFAWYIPAAMPPPCRAIILLHGWGGNASTLLPAGLALHHAGYAVLLPETRNHGRSDRKGYSALPSFAEDLNSAIDWLAAQPEVDAEQIITMGHSVGAAAVLLSASQRQDVRAVVSVSAFAHPEQVMQRWLAQWHIPYRPLGWLVNRYIEQVIGKRFNDIAPSHTLPSIQCPVLLLHGIQDTTVPIEDARHLWRLCGPNVTLMECNGTHEGFEDLDIVTQRILSFLQHALTTKHLDQPPGRLTHNASSKGIAS